MALTGAIRDKLHEIISDIRGRKPLEIVLALAVLIQFAFIAYVNLFTIDEVLDNDMAKLFVHIAEMWRTKSVLIPGWIYTTTVEIDCPAIIAVFLYGITDNIYLSSGISNIVFLILYLYIIHELAQCAGFSRGAGLLAMLAVMIPYSFGQLLYFNLMFFGGAYYCMKASVPLIAIYILVSDDPFDKRRLPVSVICLCFIFITAFSSGVYVSVCGLLPVLMVYVLMASKTVRKSIFALISVLLSMTGILLNARVPYEMKGLNSSLVTEDSIGESVRSLVMCYIEMLGGLPYEDTRVMSAQGIKYVLKFALILVITIFMIIFIFKAARSFYRAEHGIRAEIPEYIAVLILLDVFILVMTGLGTQSRYLLPSFVPLLIISAMELWEKLIMRNGALTGFLTVAAILVIALLSDRDVLLGDPYPFYRTDALKYDALDEMLAKYPDRDVVFLNDTGTTEVLRARNLNSGREYFTLMNEDGGFEDGLSVCDYYAYATDPEAISKDHILVVNESFGDISELPEDMAAAYEPVDEYQIFTVYLGQR